jgi:hypothetical protein
MDGTGKHKLTLGGQDGHLRVDCQKNGTARNAAKTLGAENRRFSRTPVTVCSHGSDNAKEQSG